VAFVRDRQLRPGLHFSRDRPVPPPRPAQRPRVATPWPWLRQGIPPAHTRCPAGRQPAGQRPTGRRQSAGLGPNSTDRKDRRRHTRHSGRLARGPPSPPTIPSHRQGKQKGRAPRRAKGGSWTYHRRRSKPLVQEAAQASHLLVHGPQALPTQHSDDEDPLPSVGQPSGCRRFPRILTNDSLIRFLQVGRGFRP